MLREARSATYKETLIPCLWEEQRAEGHTQQDGKREGRTAGERRGGEEASGREGVWEGDPGPGLSRGRLLNGSGEGAVRREKEEQEEEDHTRIT